MQLSGQMVFTDTVDVINDLALTGANTPIGRMAAYIDLAKAMCKLYAE